MKSKNWLSSLIIFTIIFSLAGFASAKPITLLNVSYDPTRELYEEYNKAFAAHWKEVSGQDVTINQSHG